MQAYFQHHLALVASHRQRYFIDACAALMGAKEIRVRDDCGIFPRLVDHKFIQGMEGHLPQISTRAICGRNCATRSARKLPRPSSTR